MPMPNKTIYINSKQNTAYELAQRIAVIRGFQGISEYIMYLIEADLARIGEDNLKLADDMITQVKNLLDK